MWGLIWRGALGGLLGRVTRLLFDFLTRRVGKIIYLDLFPYILRYGKIALDLLFTLSFPQNQTQFARLCPKLRSSRVNSAYLFIRKARVFKNVSIGPEVLCSF